MTRIISRTRRRVAIIAQLSCYPLIIVLSQGVGLPSGLASGLGLVGFGLVSMYLYYKTGLWQLGNAPDEQVDERQIQIRNQAYRFAYIGLSTAVLIAVIFFTLANDFHWAIPNNYDQLSSLFWVVWSFVLTLPSTILAWTEPDIYGAIDEPQPAEWDKSMSTQTKKMLSIGLLLTGLSGIVQAQDHALLYKVTGPGLTQPSYLYGTFHLICPTDLTITDAIQQAMDSTQQVYLELDMDDPAMMGSMQKAMLMPGGKTVKDLLSPDDYTVLDNYLKQKMNMGLAQLGMLKPIGLMSMMYMTMLPCQPASYDLTFAQMAAKDKKEVLGLESLDAELAAMDKIPMEEQLKGLVDMAKKPDAAKKEFTNMVEIYKSHDLAKLMNTMKTSQFSGADFSQFEESLLADRNANWIPVIEKAAKEKPTFFAFGAGHLGNEKGVVNLLRKKGYTVKPVE